MSAANINEKLHVALAFDEGFAIPAYATMRAICLTTTRRADLVFHLCHPAISNSVTSVLNEIVPEFGATLIHHDLSQKAAYQHLAEIMPHTKIWTAVMYARITLDTIVGKDVKRVVYLDCDLLVRAPIEQLLGADLEGSPLGAIREPHSLRFAHGRDARTNHDLFESADPFFNSGVLVIDTEAWREINIAKRLQTMETDGILARFSNDQQMLNFLFKNNWKALDGSWNMFASSRAIEGLNPKIVHYTGLNKPWNLISILPFARVYRHMMTNELYYRFALERFSGFWKNIGAKLIGRG